MTDKKPEALAVESLAIKTIHRHVESLATEVAGSIEFKLGRELTAEEQQAVFQTVRETVELGSQLYASGARVTRISPKMGDAIMANVSHSSITLPTN